MTEQQTTITEPTGDTTGGGTDTVPASSGADTLTDTLGADTLPAGGDKAWYEGIDGIDDETVGMLQNKGWDKKPEGLIKGYKELEKMKGAPADRLVVLPEDMADPEAMKAVYSKLGVPKEVGDNYNDMGDVPEGLPIDDGFKGAMAEAAHEAGISPAQFKQLAEKWNGMVVGQQGAMQEQITAQGETEIKELEKEWGAAYSGRVELAKRAVSQFGAADMLDKIEGQQGAAGVIKLFANIADAMGEHKFVEPEGGGPAFGKTPQQYAADKKALTDEIKADPKRLALYNSGKGSDVEKMNQLRKLASGQ